VSAARRAVTLLSLASLSSPALAPAEPLAREVPLFAITKSENKNHVVYALHLDARCVPAGDTPIRPFWRMLEKGAAVVEPLLAREERAYGVARQRVSSDVVRMTLRAMPDREITVITWRAGDTCAAAAWTTVAGARARLVEVHAVLAWPFGVDHLLVRGVTREGRTVEEAVDP
jgi:hypothetical protein